MSIIIPPLKPIPLDATDEERAAMYEEYKQELIDLNPNHLDSDGNTKGIDPAVILLALTLVMPIALAFVLSL
ncbi:hypothetical protein KAU11_11020 [Candidatus Babeliales bacterium]|nr:hypothetical protein [Candidatus Babeliales bacterium]